MNLLFVEPNQGIKKPRHPVAEVKGPRHEFCLYILQFCWLASAASCLRHF